MSLHVPLTVRLQTSRADRHVTRELRNLQFRKVAPGGFASATFSLDRPLTMAPEEIQYYSRVYIYDGHNGRTVWEGRLEDPGKGSGADGQIWEIAAVGPSAHASDRKVPLIYVDGSSQWWRRHSSSSKNASTATDENDDETLSLVHTFNEGSTAATGDMATMNYRALRQTGQFLARVRTRAVNGGTSTFWEDRLLTQGSAGAVVQDSQTWSTTANFLFAERGGTPAISAGHDLAFFRSQRVGTSGAATANSWASFDEVVVRAMLKDASGNDITSGYTSNAVRSYEIVRDLLGRLLAKYDGPNASIDATSTYDIDQLAYPDGATAAEILEDLMLLDPAYYWTTGPSNSAGLYSFAWKQWPTSVRYEADVVDGFDSPGSAEGLFNAVNVRWVSPIGNIRMVRRTQTVPELTDAGLTREDTIDLGDNLGSSSAATKVGDAYLAEHKTPPNAGTLTIARPILDMDTGRMVMPWEIEPGYLIRTRGVRPNVNSLNATARDGVTVFRVIAVDFDAATASATLELDSYPRTVSRALAQLAKRRITRRR